LPYFIAVFNLTRSLAANVAIVVLVIMVQGPAAASPPPVADEDAPTAGAFLKFSSEIDGRCQILSDGGKLFIMTNVHPSRSISYRLIRYFAGVPQPGRAMGTIAPGAAPKQLGCTRVDGREQRWEIQLAEFVDGSD